MKPGGEDWEEYGGKPFLELGKICNFHGMWHQSSIILFRVHRSSQSLHREDLEKAFEVVNALAKYKPQIRLTTNGTNHMKELLQNTQIFNEPI